MSPRQALQEYFPAATGKLGVGPGIAQGKVEPMSRFDVIRLQAHDVAGAFELHRFHQRTPHQLAAGKISIPKLQSQ